ncbi:PKD domain-containing protein [Pseudomonadota bacterium]
MKVFKIFLIINILILLVSCGGGGGGGGEKDNGTIDSDLDANTDITPDPIVFSPQLDVALSSLITSNTAVISGINIDANISVDGGEYSINNNMFISTQSTVSANDQIKVRHTSSSSNDTKTITKLTIGDKTFEFSSVTVSFGANNIRPTANAGIDQNVTTGNAVFLDGGGSSDADGGAISFNWTLDAEPNGSNAIIISNTTQTPVITPDLDGTYTISLVVNDGILDSVPDTVDIVATSVPNNAPIANAGIDQSVITGNAVFLDGSGSSDVDGDSISYAWTLDSAPSGSASSLISSATQTPSITPDLDGTYIISLVVNDGVTDSVPDTVNIVATPVSNTAPVANAGLDVIVYVGTTVFLDGSGSFDDDGDSITYQWSGISPPGSTATLFDNDTEYPSFSADVIGTFTLTLTVNDGIVDSPQDSVNVTVVSLPVSSNIVVYSGNTYLGCWSCNEFNSDSIHNSFSQYGSEFGVYSIRNNFSLYGSSFSSTSACNAFAASPPVIVDNNFYYGTISVNTFNGDSICNQFSSFYSSVDCAILQNYCSDL